MGNMIYLSENAISALSAMNTNYDEINNLMQDVALGREIVSDGKVISKSEANAKIREFSLKVLGIEDPRSRRNITQGLRKHSREWLDIIEETVEVVVDTAFHENEWFNMFVEQKTIGYGDRADFYSEQEAFLAVAKAGESHHDHVLQRLAAGQVVSIPTYRYVVKVGADINRYVAGQTDWATLIQAIAKAFIQKTQEETYNALDTAVTKLPVTTGFIGTGALSGTTKAAFDDIIANVSEANGGAGVAIFGTKTGLKKINALADVSWADDAQKSAMTNTGLLGTYEGTTLVEVPQRFKDRTMTAKVFNDKKLFVMPLVDQKIVKFVDEGETLINAIEERGEQNGRWDDIMTYEVQRRFGSGVIIGRYFGQWTLSA